MDKTKLKDFILKSGVPLEMSVIKKLMPNNFFTNWVGKYERNGKTFFNDFLASKFFSIRDGLDMYVNFLVECKYKSENHSWYFFKNPTTGSPESVVENYVFNQFFEAFIKSKNLKLNHNEKSNIMFEDFGFPIVNKGIDISEKDGTENNILEAISQVSYGSLNAQYEGYIFFSEVIEEIFVFWILRNNLGINEMKKIEHRGAKNTHK